jgi:hypothetical protein
MSPRVAGIVLVLSWVGAPLAGQSPRFLPVDEASRVPDFFAFRAQLLVTLARRDTSALMAVVAPEIHNTFGDDNGAVAFRRRWRLGAQDSELWGELAAVLGLGGSFENDSTFVAPYVFSRWPGDYDAFDYLAVIGANVRLRSEPNDTSTVLKHLTFELVERARRAPRSLTAAEGRVWEAVRVDTNRVGYVANRFLRSPVGYRAVFVRRGSQWSMISLIAGD